jgi:hypothetical protein
MRDALRIGDGIPDVVDTRIVGTDRDQHAGRTALVLARVTAPMYRKASIAEERLREGTAGRRVSVGSYISQELNNKPGRCAMTTASVGRGCAKLAAPIYFHEERSAMRKASLAWALVICISLVPQSSSYRVTHTYLLGGDSSWINVVTDAQRHRVFIARQNQVRVVDVETGKVLGEVTGIQGAHGTSVAEGTSHGFATGQSPGRLLYW